MTGYDETCRYIWYGMSYNQLRTILKKDKSLKVLPLVDSSEQMILLGSIQRRELVTAIERQVGVDRRLAVKSSRRREAELERRRKMREVNLQKQEEKILLLQEQLQAARLEKTEENSLGTPPLPNTDRRPSRFEVSSVAEQRSPAPSSPSEPMSPGRSRKGILKNCSVSDVNATVSGFPSARQFSFPSPAQSLASLSTAADKWRFCSDHHNYCPTDTCSRYTVHSLSAMFSDPGSGSRRKLHFNNLDMSPQEMKESSKT